MLSYVTPPEGIFWKERQNGTQNSAKLEKMKKNIFSFVSIDENLPENFANLRNMFSMKSGQVDP